MLPDWVSIYFMKTSDTEHRCNICEGTINTTEKHLELLDHVKSLHKEVYDLHKENADAGVGFRIEFLHLNVLKDNGDPKTQPIILGEVCETATEEIIPPVSEKPAEMNLEVMAEVKKVAKKPRRNFSDQGIYFSSDFNFSCPAPPTHILPPAMNMYVKGLCHIVNTLLCHSLLHVRMRSM